MGEKFFVGVGAEDDLTAQRTEKGTPQRAIAVIIKGFWNTDFQNVPSSFGVVCMS